MISNQLECLIQFDVLPESAQLVFESGYMYFYEKCSESMASVSRPVNVNTYVLLSVRNGHALCTAVLQPLLAKYSVCSVYTVA